MRPRLLAALAAAVLLSSGVATGPALADTDPPPVGKILSSAPATLDADLTAVGTGTRITYVSTDSAGNKITVSGILLVPKNKPATGGKIVAWDHGTDGLADQCAPSTKPNLDSDPNYSNYSDEVTAFLKRGYTVAATDYPGLGTPGPHPYLIIKSEARATVDVVRAAVKNDPTLSTDYEVVGHSQGGQAAAGAAEAQATYGSGLRLVGTVALAPATDLGTLAQTIAGKPTQGFLPIALAGQNAVDPSVVPSQVLAPPAVAQLGVLDTGCLNDILSAYGGFTANQLLPGGVLPTWLVPKFDAQNPGQVAPSGPVFLAVGSLDPIIPVSAVDHLKAAYCGFGARVTETVYAGSNHDQLVGRSLSDVLSWTAARFAGTPAGSSC